MNSGSQNKQKFSSECMLVQEIFNSEVICRTVGMNNIEIRSILFIIIKI